MREYLALGDGSPGFPQNFTYSVVLGNALKRATLFYLQGYHPLWLTFPGYSVPNMVFYSSGYREFAQKASRYTGDTTVHSLYISHGLGCFLFARHYSGNHYCFLFHQVLRCFSSLGCLLPSYEFRWR